MTEQKDKLLRQADEILREFGAFHLDRPALKGKEQGKYDANVSRMYDWRKEYKLLQED